MNTTDSSRPIGTLLGAAVGVALAAMSLAAGCGSSKSSGTKTASAGTTTSPSAAGATSSSSGSVDGGASPSVAGSGSSSLPPKPTDPGAGGPRDCSTDMLSFKIQALREPINHVMISATNASHLPCHLNMWPALRTFQAQTTTIRAAEATKPAGAILLNPGATAYAGVMTSSADGSGSNGRTVTALELQLQSSGNGGVGRPVSVPMPSGAQYVDSSASVTYWESDLQSATY